MSVCKIVFVQTKVTAFCGILVCIAIISGEIKRTRFGKLKVFQKRNGVTYALHMCWLAFNQPEENKSRNS